MPELPEVETIRQDLLNHVKGKSILAVEVRDRRVIFGELDDFLKKCRGKEIFDIARRGKAVVISLKGGGYLIVQLGMTGQLVCSSAAGCASHTDKSTKIIFQLSNDLALLYNDQRLFGRVYVADHLEDVAFFKTIGPEPLGVDFNVAWLIEQLKKRKSPIKSLLLNQQFVAGIGNIYASEILFDAQIKPQRLAYRLRLTEIESLYRSTIRILQKAIRYRGTSMRNYRDGLGRQGQFKNRIKVYGREAEHCLVCRTPIERIVQSGRSTFYCRKCQR